MSRTGGTQLAATRTAGFLLFACSAIFLAAMAACIAMAPFLLEDNNLSEFGIHPPTALIFNGALVLVGTMTVVAAWCFGGRQAWLVAGLLVVAGAGMVGAGVVTVEIDRMAHAIFAGIDYAGHLLLTLIIARTLVGGLRAAGHIAVTLSIVLLLLWVFQAPFLFDTIRQAGAQLLTTLPLVAWMVAYSSRLIRSRAARDPRLRIPAALRRFWLKARLTNAG
ncbi:MAG: DUF998 domain-containing protein [Bauldia sp.]|nr:DUF998 domain-containing protein [Bauldia sp.]